MICGQYDNLRGQAAAMKRRYEDRISELEQEVETMATRQKELQQQLQQSRQQQQTAAATTTVSGGASAADVATEVHQLFSSFSSLLCYMVNGTIFFCAALNVQWNYGQWNHIPLCCAKCTMKLDNGTIFFAALNVQWNCLFLCSSFYGVNTPVLGGGRLCM